MAEHHRPPRAARVLLASTATLALGACGPAPTGDAQQTLAETVDLHVCLPENDPPRSQRGKGGLDLDVAGRLASELGRRLTIVWLPEEEQTDIESTDVDFRPLLLGQCDLQLSVPGTVAVERFRGWLVLSEPYYGAGFELIPYDSAFRFGEPFSETVAVRANTVAHLALNAAGVGWSQKSSNAGIVQAVTDGAAAAGLVWGPQLAILDIDHNADFEAPSVLRWNLHAAFRKDSTLRGDVDRLFDSAAFQAHVGKRLVAHGIPVRGPFESAHTTSDLLEL